MEKATKIAEIEGMLLECRGPASRSAAQDIFKLCNPSPPSAPLSPPCPPTQPPVSSQLRATDLLHIVSVLHMQKRKGGGKKEKSKAQEEKEKWNERQGEETCSNPMFPVSQLDEEIIPK